MRAFIAYSHEDRPGERKVSDELRKPLKQLCRMYGVTRGNVLADLGLPDPGERQTETRLAMALNHIIKDRCLKQAEAAALLGVSQPKVSALMNCRPDGFSVEKLMHFIVALGRDVEIVVRPKRGDAEARVSVLEAV